jgi:hypothetical protein
MAGFDPKRTSGWSGKARCVPNSGRFRAEPTNEKTPAFDTKMKFHHTAANRGREGQRAGLVELLPALVAVWINHGLYLFARAYVLL